ncbi:MAG: hypothetical protein IKP58_16820 [Victivallales bacterium]|nr:hypothetical protein [Victivallales bacterium]
MECKDLNNDKASLDLKSSLQEMTFSDDEFMAFPDVMKAELLKADNECAWRAVNYKVVANAFLNDNRIRYKADFCGIELEDLKGEFYAMVMRPGNMDKLVAKCEKSLVGVFRSELWGYVTAVYRKKLNREKREVDWPVDEEGRPMDFVANSRSPEQEAERKDKVKTARRALLAGYDDDRLGVFVVLLRTQGMDYAEICDQLELSSETAVRQMYSRAIKLLKEKRRKIEKGV